MEGRPSKRQRASPTSSSTSDSDDSPALNPMEIFRRHFESRFQAIDGPPIAALDPTSSSNTIDEGSDVEDGEEWSGISASEESESEENTSVEVVYHTSSAYSEARRMSKRKLSEFMVFPPPIPPLPLYPTNAYSLQNRPPLSPFPHALQNHPPPVLMTMPKTFKMTLLSSGFFANHTFWTQVPKPLR